MCSWLLRIKEKKAKLAKPPSSLYQLAGTKLSGSGMSGTEAAWWCLEDMIIGSKAPCSTPRENIWLAAATIKASGSGTWPLEAPAKNSWTRTRTSCCASRWTRGTRCWLLEVWINLLRYGTAGNSKWVYIKIQVLRSWKGLEGRDGVDNRWIGLFYWLF